MAINSYVGELSTAGNFLILSGMNEKELERRVKELDKRREANLRRLRLSSGWSQEQLFEKTGIGQTKISAYENGLGFDKETLVRFCDAFKVKEWEFDWDVSVPVILDDREQHAVDLFRTANSLGIADQVREQEEIWIERAKKKGGAAGESQEERLEQIGQVLSKYVPQATMEQMVQKVPRLAPILKKKKREQKKKVG